MNLTKQNMPETLYRASRCCRVLGNPTAYLILRCLGRERKTPTELSSQIRIPLVTISGTLRNLRQVDLVRYETRWKEKEYRVKAPEVVAMLDSLEQWVQSMRKAQF